MMITFIVTLSLVCALASSNDTLKVRALSFGRTNADYVQFQPGDMSPFSTSFTICSWMKRLHDASKPIVLHYFPWELIIGDNGYFNYANGNLDLRGKFPEAKQWFHHCLSWVAGGTQRVYVNGVELGSTSASASNLPMGGTIALGNQVQSHKSTNHIFGGQLLKLNWYSEELTSSQIREMFEAGMCSTVEEEYSSREIKWELILTKQRYGNVTEFLPTECGVDCKTKLEETQTALEESETKLQKTQTALEESETKHQETKSELTESETQHQGTKTELTELESELQEAHAALEESETKHQETKSELTESETQHQGTKTELTELESELQETQAALEESETKHQETKSELTESETQHQGTKTELSESETELQQKENKLIKTEQELQEITKTLNNTLSELTKSRTEMEENKADSRELKIELQETDAKLNSTQQELQENTKTQNGNLLEQARSLETVSRWDVLFTPPYLNKLFTRQLYNQLTNCSWDMMEEFIGVNVTVGLVEHFRQNHVEHETCDEE